MEYIHSLNRFRKLIESRLRAWEDVALVVKSIDPEGKTLDATRYDAKIEELLTLLRYLEPKVTKTEEGEEESC